MTEGADAEQEAGALHIRPARAEDVDTILAHIRGLAAFEREPDAVRVTREDLLRDGFGPQPGFEVLLAELSGRPAGMALFFPNYSTWEGARGLYLEELYLEEWARGRGVGRQLMAALARLCVARGYRRLDLSVLDWNPARGFYEHLGLRDMQGWRPYRLSGDALARLAADSTGC